MSHISVVVITKATVKLANGKAGHAQVVKVFFVCLPNLTLIYPVVPVFIVLVTLPIQSRWVTLNVNFFSLHLNLLNIVNFFTLNVSLEDHPTKLRTL